MVLELAEVRVITCEPSPCRTDSDSVFVAAVFTGCPVTGRKFSSPQGADTHSGLSSWADCALVCGASTDCLAWHWDTSGLSCTTMTAQAGLTDDTNFISGFRNCTARSLTAGWVTCSANNPYDAATAQKHEASLC